MQMEVNHWRLYCRDPIKDNSIIVELTISNTLQTRIDLGITNGQSAKENIKLNEFTG